MSYVKGAALHCQNREFWAFLSKKTGQQVSDKETASVQLRALCGISSRKELAKNYSARSMYVQLINEFNHFLKDQRGRA